MKWGTLNTEKRRGKGSKEKKKKEKEKNKIKIKKRNIIKKKKNRYVWYSGQLHIIFFYCFLPTLILAIPHMVKVRI
jgi:hypothetical protein